MYVKAKNQTVEKFPYTLNDLKKDHPNVSFPKKPSDDVLAEWDVYPVIFDERPQAGLKEATVQADKPDYVDGKWVLRWTVKQLSNDEFAQKIKAHKEALQHEVTRHMDRVAAEKNYDSILSACTYAAFDNPFKEDGLKAIAWRSAVWVKCYEVLDYAQSGLRDIPTPEELIAELPKMDW